MKATSWSVLPIKEVYEGLYDGPHATPNPSDDGPIFLGIKNVTDDGCLDFTNTRHISEEDFSAWTRRVLPKENDLVFTYEATLNRYALIPQGFRGCLGRRMALIRINANKIHPKYLFYYFFSAEWREVIRKNTLTGATVDRIPLTAFPDFPIRVPGIHIQNRVVNILSAYDGLIANNTRRIEILDSITRSLYKKWFVSYGYQGEKELSDKAEYSSEIPANWEIKKIGDVFHTMLGGTPSRAKVEYWEGGNIPWINSGKVNDLRIIESSEFITELALKKSAAKLMPKGTTVLAITGATLGQVSYLEIPTSANQSVVGVVDPTGLMSEWIYLTLCDRIEEIVKFASGGAQQHINKEIVNDIKLVIPPVDVSNKFKELVSPMFGEIGNLLFQNKNLRYTRDLILSRIFSGQIEL